MGEKSPTFADYYVRFIGQFVSVYESSAPAFARDSLRWSASQKNIDRYHRNGRKKKMSLEWVYMTLFCRSRNRRRMTMNGLTISRLPQLMRMKLETRYR